MTTAAKLLEFLVLFGAFIAAGWYVRRLFSGPVLAPKEVKAQLDAGAELVLLDVRTPEEFAGEHLEGALNLPLHELDGRLRAAGGAAAYGDTPVVLVCRSGSRAHAAARILKRHGLRNARVMTGGMIAWNGAGLPVARGAT